MDLREELKLKNEALKEKYVDVINDLAVKYKKDVGVGFDMLKAMARARILGEEPLYTSDIEYNADELVKDYSEILELSERIVNEEV